MGLAMSQSLPKFTETHKAARFWMTVGAADCLHMMISGALSASWKNARPARLRSIPFIWTLPCAGFRSLHALAFPPLLVICYGYSLLCATCCLSISYLEVPIITYLPQMDDCGFPRSSSSPIKRSEGINIIMHSDLKKGIARWGSSFLLYNCHCSVPVRMYTPSTLMDDSLINGYRLQKLFREECRIDVLGSLLPPSSWAS